jgi:hypothetical protein
MGRGQFRNWWSLGAAAVAAVAVAWLLYLLYRSPRRDGLSTYGAFVFPVAAVVFGWLAWAWRKGKGAQTAAAADSAALDRAADELAAAVEAQWKTAAEERELTGADPIRVTWGRPSLPMAGPPTAAAGSHRFSPLPGLAAAAEANLESGNAGDLHALYGGLRSGRLIVAGPPGSGKTGAAVLLILAALRYRDQAPPGDRAKIPVPVLVTAQDWDPHHQRAVDWLTGKLQATYPLFTTPAGTANAAALLTGARITVILDGLDEISPGLRPVALQALSQQATFRLVILSRTSEMAAAAASQGVLHGAAAVQLNPVSPADAASYLDRVQLDPPPPGWQELSARIRADPGSPLSAALDNPLALTLVRDTYQATDSINELLDFCDTTLDGVPAERAASDITDHLLDRVLPAAYTHRPGEPLAPYDLATAQRTLAAIAARMRRDGTRDINWWQIPAWAPRTPRAAISAIVLGLATGLAVGLAVGLATGLEFGLLAGVLAGLAAGITERPYVIGDLRLTKALTRRNLVLGLAAGLAVGLAAGLAAGLGFGLAVGLAAGLAAVFAAGFLDVIRADPDSNDALNPATSWHRNRSFGLVLGLGLGLAAGLGFGLAVGLAAGPVPWLAVGLAVGLVLGLVGTETYPVTLASMQLAIEWRTPVRLMRFLDDAHSRNVLRAVGPSYQFRHARLQDRLAAAASPRDSKAPVPEQESTATVSPDSGPAR